ncbi:hypothetical protein FRB95_013011 [Tulasnella sp. JGI-2019a]|nr:hypothetical protein FRB95_013011 [Tulasnella sp. JGI-2019a]
MKTGLKMNLYQLTASAKIVGYVKLSIWTKDTSDHWVCMDAELYVVPNMDIPMLLGKDFHVNYDLMVYHKLNEGSRAVIGNSGRILATHTTKDSDPAFALRVLAKLEPMKHYMWKKQHNLSR